MTLCCVLPHHAFFTIHHSAIECLYVFPVCITIKFDLHCGAKNCTILFLQ